MYFNFFPFIVIYQVNVINTPKHYTEEFITMFSHTYEKFHACYCSAKLKMLGHAYKLLKPMKVLYQNLFTNTLIVIKHGERFQALVREGKETFPVILTQLLFTLSQSSKYLMLTWPAKIKEPHAC